MKNYDLVILGAGKSGAGAAYLAKEKGYSVFISDFNAIDPKIKEEFRTRGIDFEENKHSAQIVYKAGEVIKSPGIPNTVPIVQGILERGIPMISDIEYASRFTNSFFVGITGSNGKTTTTSLIEHLLKSGTRSVKASGNIGFSFAWDVLNDPKDVYVLELSSFQLEMVKDLRLDIAILLNISPDHLDRYDGDIKQYGRAKMNIIKNSKASDIFFYNWNDVISNELIKEAKTKARKIPIAFPENVQECIELDGFRYELSNAALRGRHNAFNAEVAIRVAIYLGLRPLDIQVALNNFHNQKHRLQTVGYWRDVQYINDSKATNVEAVFFALEAVNRPIIWLVGGQDKGNNYDLIAALVENKVKSIIALGADNSKIINYFSKFDLPIVEAKTMTQAIDQARKQAVPGDAVLLSPACASFDLFKNYEQRGDLFIQEVNSQEKTKG